MKNILFTILIGSSLTLAAQGPVGLQAPVLPSTTWMNEGLGLPADTFTVATDARKRVFVAVREGTSWIYHPKNGRWTKAEGTEAQDLSQLSLPKEVTGFSTLVSLRLTEGARAGQLVRTLGYHTPGDGGGGDYIWNPASRAEDDGGSVLRPKTVEASAPGRWIAVFYGKVNLLQFGAKADFNGTTGTSIKPYFDKMVAFAAGRCTMVIPKGDYYSDGRVEIRGYDNVVIEGERGARIFKAKEGVFGTGECLLEVQDAERVRISGLTLYGHTPGLQYKLNKYNDTETVLNPGDGGLYIYDSRDVEVTGCSFYNFGDGAIRMASVNLLNGTVSTKRAWVHHNYFRNIYQITTTYTRGAGAAAYTVSDNVFDSLKGSVKFASRAPGAGQFIIRNNTIRNAFHIGFEFANVSDVQLLNNVATAADTTKVLTTAISIYPNLPGSGSVVHGNMNDYLIRGGTIKGFKKGIRIKNQMVNGVMNTIDRVHIADIDFYDLVGTANKDAAIHILSQLPEGASHIRNVVIDSVRVHRASRHGILAEYFPDDAENGGGLAIRNCRFDSVAAYAIYLTGQEATRFRTIRVEGNTARQVKPGSSFLVATASDGLQVLRNNIVTAGTSLQVTNANNLLVEGNTLTTAGGHALSIELTGEMRLTGNTCQVQGGTGRTLKISTPAALTLYNVNNRLSGGGGEEIGTGVKVVRSENP